MDLGTFVRKSVSDRRWGDINAYNMVIKSSVISARVEQPWQRNNQLPRGSEEGSQKVMIILTFPSVHQLPGPFNSLHKSLFHWSVCI